MVFTQFLAKSSKNPWNLANNKSKKDVFYYVNEVTFGKYLRMGAVARGTDHKYMDGNFSFTP